MSPHSEKEQGGRRGDNRGLSISEGGMMVSLPLTSPSPLLPAPPQTKMCQQELSMEEFPPGEKQACYLSISFCESTVVKK